VAKKNERIVNQRNLTNSPHVFLMGSLLHIVKMDGPSHM
jgi:hypothetical protein